MMVRYIDKEISTRCKKASIAFGRLWRNVFGRKDISVEVKIQMYRATVLATLLYGCETWAAKQKQLIKLAVVQFRCLRKILGIQWTDKITTYKCWIGHLEFSVLKLLYVTEDFSG